MFETVVISLNGTNVNKQAGKYPYRSYITKLLSYPEAAKHSWMQSEGWYEDDLAKFDPSTYSTDSVGFKQRRELFMQRKEDEKDPEDYSDKYIMMMGKIYSDLNNVSTGIPPGIKINVRMEFSNDKFRIVSKAGTGIHIEINKVVLHMPIGALNPNLYRAIEHKMAKEACKIFYTRFELQHFTINRGTQTFNQIINTSTTSGASRMIIFFLTLLAFNGDYTLNPYEFSRRWGVKDSVDVSKINYFYVQKVEISLNGRPLECLNGNATEHDDQISFLRLHQILGNMGQPTGNGINYRKWCDNSSLFLFDLTVTGRSASTNDVMSPIVKTGDTRLDVTFGENPTQAEMKVIVLQEFPSLFTISKDRTLNFSYYSSTQ